MTVTITDGNLSAIRLLRTIAARAPAAEKAKYRAFGDNEDWDGLVTATKPLVRKMALAPFTAAEIRQVAWLTEPQRDVMTFYNDIRIPAMDKLRARIDSLIEWTAWETVAKVVAAIPNIPFRFDAHDVRTVFDPDNSLGEISDGVAQAKTFLAALASDPELKELHDRVQQYVRWGGFQSIVDIVEKSEKIPYRFTADDVRALTDPGWEITSRPPDQIPLLEIWEVFRTSTDEDVVKFYADLDKRVHHGCWESIAKILNKLEKFPIKPIKRDLVRATLDPTQQYGDDRECASCGPPPTPPTPGWVSALVWSIGAGTTVYNTYNDAKDWSVNAAGAVDDWGSDTIGDVSSFATDTYGSLDDWASDTFGPGTDWMADAGGEFAEWASDPEAVAALAAVEIESNLREISGNAARAAEDAARDVGRSAKDAAKRAADEAAKFGENTWNKATSWLP